MLCIGTVLAFQNLGKFMNAFNYHGNILSLLIATFFTTIPKISLAQTPSSSSPLKNNVTNVDSQKILRLQQKILRNTLVNAKSTTIYDARLNLLNTKYPIPFDYLSKDIINYPDKKTLKKSNESNQLLQTENTEYLVPKLPKLKAAYEFIIADVIPIESDKIKPPTPNSSEEEIELNPTQSPVSNPLDKKPENPQEQQKNQQQVILDSLSISAVKYPWIVNPTDNFTFAPQLFKPNTNERYIDVDIRFAEDNPIINKFTFGEYLKDDQFYWVLDDNRVVFETKGSQAGIVYQGKHTDIESIREVTSSQRLWGLQAVFNIPVALQDLDGEVPVEEQNFSVTSIAGRLINPEGVSSGRVIINSGVDENNPNVTVLRNQPFSIGSATTRSPNGGAELFNNVDADNAPQILQGYPTTNLKPLLGNGEVQLREGAIIPKNVLESAGILWGNIITGEGFGFTAPTTSTPGIKVAQQGKFDNPDLLNILVNPSLSERERDVSYFNSLLWVPLGRRPQQFRVLSEKEDKEDWHRLFVSYNHNRSILQYEATKVSATYTNLFSNYGLSLTTNFKDTKIDGTQTISSTLGMLLGTVFKNIKIDKIDNSLQAARKKFNSGQSFASLKTAATPAQRSQINQRLNTTLFYANSSSNLEQVSGTYTFPSKIAPKKSTVFQIRTGNYRRAVQFLDADADVIREGETFFSELDLSNQTFGPLTYIGSPIPLNQTGIQPVNESTAVEVILTNAGGQQFVQRFNSADNTSVPVNVRGADLAFDDIELTRIDDVKYTWDFFNGYLSLPTVEFVAAGTSGNFNYGASFGTWLNVNADSAPGVGKNNAGLNEPTIGIYSNAKANYIKRNVQLDSEKKPVAINTHVPSLAITWNSASNRNNPFSTFVSYYFERQQKKLGYSIAPAIAFIQNNSNGELLGILNGEFSTNKGLNLKATFEIGKQIFYSFQGLQKISDYLSAGVYFKNYSVNNIGLSSRNSGFNYGVLGRKNFKFHRVFLETQIGGGDNGFDVRFRGGYRF
jgi:hypothetical protein